MPNIEFLICACIRNCLSIIQVTYDNRMTKSEFWAESRRGPVITNKSVIYIMSNFFSSYAHVELH